MNEWLRQISPGDVLKWGAVVFAYAIGILIVIAIVLTMFGAF